MSTICMEEKWAHLLQEEWEKPYMKELQTFLQKEIQEQKTIYPPSSLIFNAFCQTPFDQVKVVLLGQDPYHGEGQAHGLSFSVQKGVPLPPSLKNIFQELQQDLKVPPSKEGSLLPWAKEGVLLLNATLTVRKKEPKSHFGKGWETFTDAVITLLAEKKESLVFILWGKSAQDKYTNVLAKNPKDHLVLSSAHPSPYSASFGFFGSKPFSKTNEYLEKKGIKPINWSLE